MAWDPDWLAEIRAGERRRAKRRFVGCLGLLCLVAGLVFVLAALAAW